MSKLCNVMHGEHLSRPLTDSALWVGFMRPRKAHGSTMTLSCVTTVLPMILAGRAHTTLVFAHLVRTDKVGEINFLYKCQFV